MPVDFSSKNSSLKTSNTRSESEDLAQAQAQAMAFAQAHSQPNSQHNSDKSQQSQSRTFAPASSLNSPSPEPSIPTSPASSGLTAKQSQSQSPKTNMDKNTEPQENLNYREIFLKGLPENDIAKVHDLIHRLLDSDFLLNAMFSTDATFEFPINKHINITVRGMSNAEKSALNEYLVGKDPFEFFKDQDDLAIKKLIEEDPSLTFAQAKELFFKTFHQTTAEERRDKVLLALNVVKINGKSIGATLHERFQTLESMPAMLISLIQLNLSLLDRAINLTLLDSDILKN